MNINWGNIPKIKGKKWMPNLWLNISIIRFFEITQTHINFKDYSTPFAIPTTFRKSIWKGLALQIPFQICIFQLSTGI